MENESDLRIKDGFHSYMKEDSKSPAQVGMLNELRILITSRYCLKRVRLDQDIKLKYYVCVILCELEYRMPYYQGGCNICQTWGSRTAHQDRIFQSRE